MFISTISDVACWVLSAAMVSMVCKGSCLIINCMSISWSAIGLTMTGQWPNAEVIGVISIMSISETESR